MSNYYKRTDKFDIKYYCLVSIRRTITEHVEDDTSIGTEIEILDEEVTGSWFGRNCRSEKEAHIRYDQVCDFIFKRKEHSFQ